MRWKSPLVSSVVAGAGVIGATLARTTSGVGNVGRSLPSIPKPSGAGSDSTVTIYLTATGQVQGAIRGSVTKKGFEDTIEVLGVSHEVLSPRDAASGLPTGRRQHKPIVVTKPVDKATPLLASALTTNENLTSVKLAFLRLDRGSRKEVQYYTIELVNASIAGIEMERPADGTHEPREHVSFTYQKVLWTWQDGGVTAEDDWVTPVA